MSVICPFSRVPLNTASNWAQSFMTVSHTARAHLRRYREKTRFKRSTYGQVHIRCLKNTTNFKCGLHTKNVLLRDYYCQRSCRMIWQILMEKGVYILVYERLEWQSITPCWGEVCYYFSHWSVLFFLPGGQ